MEVDYDKSKVECTFKPNMSKEYLLGFSQIESRFTSPRSSFLPGPNKPCNIQDRPKAKQSDVDGSEINEATK
jgi:hypothetical protein